MRKTHETAHTGPPPLANVYVYSVWQALGVNYYFVSGEVQVFSFMMHNRGILYYGHFGSSLSQACNLSAVNFKNPPTLYHTS